MSQSQIFYKLVVGITAPHIMTTKTTMHIFPGLPGAEDKIDYE